MYYGETIQQYIQSNREKQEQQWVYKLIREGLANQDEQVFLDNNDFVLCTNVHHGLDDRYLVVFKDENLKTIRDLDQTHIRILTKLQRQTWVPICQAWLNRLRHALIPPRSILLRVVLQNILCWNGVHRQTVPTNDANVPRA